VLVASDTRGSGIGASGGKSISSNDLISNAPSNERTRKSNGGREKEATIANQNKQNTPKAEPD
jgi:hypothetical protein